MHVQKPDRGVGLVDRADRLDAGRVFAHARAVAERGVAEIAAACRDPVDGMMRVAALSSAQS